MVNIVFSNIQPGKYKLKIFNSAGTIVQTKSIDIIDERSIVETISLSPGRNRGLHFVQLEGNGVNLMKSIMVN
jgi:hypothetical protein